MDFAGVSKAFALAALAGFTSLFTTVDFSHTITLGSILIGLLVAVLAGVFTIRSRVATIWREEAAGWREKSEGLEKKLADTIAEGREERHALKAELAGVQSLLKVEEAKHDLNAVMDRMQSLHNDSMSALIEEKTSTVEGIADAINELGVRITGEAARTASLMGEQKKLLAQIRTALARRQGGS